MKSSNNTSTFEEGMESLRESGVAEASGDALRAAFAYVTARQHGGNAEAYFKHLSGVGESAIWKNGMLLLVHENSRAQVRRSAGGVEVGEKSWPEPMTLSDMTSCLEVFEGLMDRTFTFEDGVLTIDVSYPYQIELKRIRSPLHLVGWVHHLTEKAWMSSFLIAEFIKRVCEVKKWKFKGP